MIKKKICGGVVIAVNGLTTRTAPTIGPMPSTVGVLIVGKERMGIEMDLHPNTLKLMRINEKAIALGYVGDFCRDVAAKMEELGNDHPSDNAILFAENWIKRLENESSP